MKIFFNYGLTEAMRTSILALPKDSEGLGSSGRPLSGVDVSIRSADGQVLGANARGEIWVKGKNVALGYDDREAWNQVCDGEYFNTRDVGFLDEKGFLYVLGRSNDAIKINQKIFFAVEFENFINKRHTLGIEFAVVQITKNSKPEQLILVSEGESMSTKFLKMVNSEISAEFGKDVFFVHNICIDRFPRTNNGKLQRSNILDMVDINDY